MTKAIYIALTWLAAGGSVYAETSLPASLAGSSIHQYTHLLDTNQSQTFEPSSQAALFLEQPVSVQNSIRLASVNFLVGNNRLEFDAPDFTDERPVQCKKLGFTLTSCSSGTPTDFCPYDNSYFASCCDARYKYSQSNCSYPNTISGDSCGGKYMCYCDRSLYPVTSCEAPKVVSEDKCVEDGVTYYASCGCPASYTETCDGANLQGKGIGCTVNGETKYAACECKAGYTLTCSDLGPEHSSDYCLKDGVKYFNSCKTCENKCTLETCPAGTTCSFEECSGKYCATGCATGSYDLENYWCDGALKCWFPSQG